MYQKSLAFVFLFSFLVVQYGKLASYWQCRISAETTAAYCECEKLLLDIHKEGSASSAATAIAKEKTEESYLWEVFAKNMAPQKTINHTPSPLYHSLIAEDHTKNIFQPPRV